MAAGLELYNDVLNQKGSPALYSDTFANRPTFGYTGRLFISTDTNEIYRDTGTAWVLISSGGGGTNIYNSNGTLTANRTLTNGGFSLTFTGAANPFVLNIDANANTARTIAFTTASSNRWAHIIQDNETGGNAGSNYYLRNYTDGGATLFDVVYIERKTGKISVASEEILSTNGAAIVGLYNAARGTYTLAGTYTGGSPQGANFNIFTYDARANLTHANSQYVATYSSVFRLEPTDSYTITMAQGANGVRTLGPGQNQIQFNVPVTKTLTVSHGSGLTIPGIYDIYTGTRGNLTITNAYGLVINPLDEYGYATLTMTNRWGIYQGGSLDTNYFNGTTLIGTTTATGEKLVVSGTARVTQSAYFATSSGNVGIGTTTNGISSTAFTQLTIKPVGVATVTAINLQNTTSNRGTIYYDGTKLVINTPSSSGSESPTPIDLQTNDATRLRITTGGNVLIGTTSDPGILLNVNGNARVSNTIDTVGDLNLRSINATTRIYIGDTGTANNQLIVGNNSNNAFIMVGNNFGIQQTTFGTSATRTLAISTGTAPGSSPADCFQLYSADITAGNAAAHFRTENGAIVKIYQETTAVGSATYSSPGAGSTVKTDDTFDGYTLQQVVKALRNQGILA